MGRGEEAEARRAEARGLFTRLGAAKWLRDLDAVWEGN
jgi:hypothetical protein